MTMNQPGDMSVKITGLVGNSQKPVSVDEVLQQANRLKRRASSPSGGTIVKRSLSPTLDMVAEDASPCDDTGDHKIPKVISDLDKLKVQGIQYTLSNRGAFQLILNRFIYNLYNKRQSNELRWRCVEYRDNRCLACVITKDGVVKRRINMHNHVFHDKKILTKIQKKIVFLTMEEVEDARNEKGSKANASAEVDE